MNIKKLAKKAGYKPLKPKSFADELQEIFLSKFAELVAAAEREECAKVCEEWSKTNWTFYDFAKAIRARGDKHEHQRTS